MDHSGQPSLRDELPAHGAWMRRLARSLVADEASADDLVQEASLAALRREGSIRGALRPWLARVTHNFARRGWRDAARRVEREAGAARSEAQPGADETSARLETQRQLLEELARLDPPVRTALVRRYLDGWSAARIARETGEPAATVRWRLQRGLAELRARLDQRGRGDGIQWRLALLPLCGHGAPWSAAVEGLRPILGGSIPGVLFMKATVAWVAALVVAGVGLGAWWISERQDGEVRGKAELALAAAPPRAEVSSPAMPELAPAPAEREAVLPLEVAAGATRVTAPTPEATRVSGRCLDADLVPIGGARIARVDGDGRTDASSQDGTFALELAPPHGSSTLRVEASGFATRFVQVVAAQGTTTQLGDVILQPGGRVRGRVFGPLGRPHAGAEISVTAPDLWGTLDEARSEGPEGFERLTAFSGPDGRFEIEGVAPAPCRVWASDEGMRHTVSAPVAVPARGSTEEVELQLEAIRSMDRITGIVLAPDGSPVPRAYIEYGERSGGSNSSQGFSAGEDGRFELAAKNGYVYDLYPRDPEGRWPGRSILDVAPGTLDLEVRFEEARWIEVSVRAASGTPVEDFVLTAENERGFLGGGRSAAAGEARLMVPDESFSVQVDARGYALASRGPFEPSAAPGELAFELEPEPGVNGHVRAGGRALAGATVGLYVTHPNTRINHNGYPSLVSPRPEDKTTTDTDGRFVLRVRERGVYYVRAEATGWAASDVGPLELLPAVGHELELVLGHGGSLEGNVLVAPGRDPSGIIVALNRGDARPLTVRSDEDGRFLFEGLTAGRWYLARGLTEVSPATTGTSYSPAKQPIAIPFNCTIVEGERARMDLDLRDWQPCVVNGTLLVNGAPAGDWTVTAWPDAAEAMVGTPPSTSTAADGGFTLAVEEEGALRLAFSPPAELGGGGRIDAFLDVWPGENRWHEDFAMGRLYGRYLAPPPSEGQSLFYRSGPGVRPACWLPVLLDEDGRFYLPFVPAGKGTISFLGESGRQLAEVEVPARGERSLEFP